MRPFMMVLVLALAACTSAEEKARQRDSAMVAQAIADSVAEQEFVQDSIKLAASISVDTVKALRLRDRPSTTDDGLTETVHVAISPTSQVCVLTYAKYQTVTVGDTLSCQWAPEP